MSHRLRAAAEAGSSGAAAGSPAASSEAASSEAGPAAQDMLGSMRARIDDLDREIVRLLNERARVGLEIGRAKHAAGISIHDPRREDEVLRRVAEANRGPVADEDLLALYREIIALTRRLEGAGGDEQG